MAYPKPQIGFYQAECCLLDLYRIDSAEDLADAEARIAENDECGELIVFATLEEAVAALRGELDEETERDEFDRLGWKEE